MAYILQFYQKIGYKFDGCVFHPLYPSISILDIHKLIVIAGLNSTLKSFNSILDILDEFDEVFENVEDILSILF